MTCEVVEISIWGRNNDGKVRSGECTFRDGKKWRWSRSLMDGSYYFTIDSGMPSQWSMANYGRMISPPKRVTALKKKLQQEGEKI
jgi:hypothetical protein